MIKKKFVLCINRQYGSGGRSVGKILAKELGIDFYDQRILQITSETSAIGEKYFRLADEKAGSNLLYKVFDGLKPALKDPSTGFNITNRDNLFKFQAKMLKELAEKETCIIAGRAADYVLKESGIEDVISMYVYCDMDKKVERIKDMEVIDTASAEKKIREKDKDRAEFYSYYTGRKWDDCLHYDLCINTTNLNFDEIANVIKDYLKTRGYI